MTQQYINIGTNPNDGTGDVMRVSFTKVDNNFSELYFTTANLTSNLSNLSTAVNAFEGYANNQFGAISNVANVAYFQANNANAVAQAAFVLANTSNSAWLAANAALIAATSANGFAQNVSNSLYYTQNGAFSQINALGIVTNTVNTIAVGAAINAKAAFDEANVVYTYMSAAFNQSNNSLGFSQAQVAALNKIGRAHV